MTPPPSALPPPGISPPQVSPRSPLRLLLGLAALGIAIGAVLAVTVTPRAMAMPSSTVGMPGQAVPGVVQPMTGAGGVMSGEASGAPNAQPIATINSDGTVIVHDWTALGKALANQVDLADAIRKGLPMGDRIADLPGVTRITSYITK